MSAAIQLAYLVSAIMFIVGLKGLSHPRTAPRGNIIAGIGMLLAVLAVLVDQRILGYGSLAIGLALGTALGLVLAVRVQMTAMPQLVAVFNGFGGIASALVAASQYVVAAPAFARMAVGDHAAESITIALAALIGTVTFTGSVLAFAKLQELVGGGAVRSSALRVLNAVLALAAIALCVAMVSAPSLALFWALVVVSAVLGVTLVAPIGGADMPVVIALLNSYSGLAAAAAGFALMNTALIISGSLVGASGLILTSIMCKAMNRSLTNVLFALGDVSSDGPSADDVYAGKVKSTTSDEVALILEGAQRVVFVPGYGMAVAQAQHAVRDLMNALTARGVEVEFAIHPVAGRMPGHMNVLLAEADVPYERLIEMEDINPTFAQVDVAIVLGANDVVNPAAREDPTSPIAGMPIIDVDKAQTVVVIKRSLSPGFAGIPNPLFAAPNTLMLFGDAKSAILEIVKAQEAG